MSTRKIKIWSSIGTYVVAGAGLALGSQAAAESGRPDMAATRPHLLAEASKKDETKPHMHPRQGGEGGEQGGEGGERGAVADASPDQAFMLQLLLIKGHLRVGAELVAEERWNDAMPHYLHPAEEIYKELAPALGKRNIAPFEKDLAELARLVKGKAGRDAVAKAQAALTAKLDAAAASLGATQKMPAFVLAVAERLLNAAADEYGEAIENGRVANPVEYQDSRGFVWTAEAYVQAIAPALKAKDAAAYAKIEEGFAALKKAWPAAVPPEGAAVATSKVQADISRIAFAMSGLR
ncbi:MAG: hypothetical protein KIT16_19365 [Rhodospirillaceae bacterium]|nr:hypothetical protein [Rhodospirillaceae bacterium]